MGNVKNKLLSKENKAKKIFINIFFTLLLTVSLFFYIKNDNYFNEHLILSVFTSLILVGLIWRFLTILINLASKYIFRKFDKANAGAFNFVLKLLVLIFVTVLFIELSNINPRAILLTGAITAVIAGLAAQQTLGNLISGTILITSRPFKVGDRIKLQVGALAGSLEGTVQSLGLLYTVLYHKGERIIIPNNTVAQAAIIPLRAKQELNIGATLLPGIKLSQVQRLLDKHITIELVDDIEIDVEDVLGESLNIRVFANPVNSKDASILADQVIKILTEVTTKKEIQRDFDTSRFKFIDGKLQEVGLGDNTKPVINKE